MTLDAPAIVTAILAHLDPSWSLEKREETCANYAALVHTSGARLGIRLSHQTPPRLEIHGWNAPARHAGRVDVPSISLAATRPADVLAREIQRRMIDAYLPAYQRALAEVAEYEADAARDLALAVELGKRGGSSGPFRADRLYLPHGTARVSNGKAYMRLDGIPADVARKICDLLKGSDT